MRKPSLTASSILAWGALALSMHSLFSIATPTVPYWKVETAQFQAAAQETTHPLYISPKTDSLKTLPDILKTPRNLDQYPAFLQEEGILQEKGTQAIRIYAIRCGYTGSGPTARFDGVGDLTIELDSGDPNVGGEIYKVVKDRTTFIATSTAKNGQYTLHVWDTTKGEATGFTTKCKAPVSFINGVEGCQDPQPIKEQSTYDSFKKVWAPFIQELSEDALKNAGSLGLDPMDPESRDKFYKPLRDSIKGLFKKFGNPKNAL